MWRDVGCRRPERWHETGRYRARHDKETSFRQAPPPGEPVRGVLQSLRRREDTLDKAQANAELIFAADSAMVLVADPSPPPTLSSPTASHKPSLAGLSRDALRVALTRIGVPEKQARMRVNQLWSWIYVRGVTRFDAMSDVSKELRATLEQHYSLARPEIVTEQVSVDGTRKWLLRLARQENDARAPEIETVYIPEPGRGTLCISSQV